MKIEETNQLPTTSSEEKSIAIGRPCSAFADMSDRNKRRRVQSLRQSTSTEELAYATQMNLRDAGKTDAANVVKNAVLSSPTKGTKYRKAINLLDIEQKS